MLVLWFSKERSRRVLFSSGGGDGAVLHLVSGNAEGARLRRLLLPKVSSQTGIRAGEEARGRLRRLLQNRKVCFRGGFFWKECVCYGL